MDQLFLAFALLGLALLALTAPIVAWIALVRTNAIARLAARVEELERQLARRAVTPQPPPSAPPAPVATPREVAAAETAKPPPSAPHVLPAPPVEVPAPAPAKPPASVARVLAPDAVPARLTAPPPSPASQAIDWERWIGVRGAAVLGGALLALAGILFLQYSIQRGWITPALRSGIGALAGLAAMAGATPLRRRGYAVTANALTGAGATILYGVAWAARVLYELVPPPAGFAAMVAITIVCGALAVRHSSQTIAVFGLVGGFATPLLLGASAESPLGLFGYLLLLDIGIVAISRKRGWPALALLATIGTPLLFCVWLATGFDERHFALALVFCGSSAVVFAAGGAPRGAESSARWLASQAAGICVPLVFAAYFASRVQLEARLLPLATLLAVLDAVALWTAWKQRTPALVAAAVLGSALTLAAWLLSSDAGAGQAWQTAVIAVLLAGVAHVGVELTARDKSPREAGWAHAANSGVLAMLAVLAIGALTETHAPLWPWLAAALALAAMSARQASLAMNRAVVVPAFAGAAFVLAAWLDLGDVFLLGAFGAARLAPALELAVIAGFAVILVALALSVREASARAWTLRAACAAVALLSLERAAFAHAPTPAIVVAECVALAACGLFCAASLRSALAFCAVAGTCWIAQASVAFEIDSTTEHARLVLLALVVTWIAISVLPLAVRARFDASALAWRAAAVACFLWSGPIAALFDELYLDAPRDFSLPDSTVLYASAALAAAITFGLRASARTATPRAAGFVWFASLACVFASFAAAFEIEHAVDLIGCALLAASLATLARALDHRGLRVIALALCAFVAPRAAGEVLAVAFDSSRELRSGWPIVHWLSYSLAVPAACLWVVARSLRASGDSPAWRTRAAGVVALAAVLVAFLWLNAEVVNLFSNDARYEFTFARKAARDMTLSASWVAFALVLLVSAVKRDRSSLRWTSLGFFLAAIAKVFLYDLGALRGLYRVGSVVGLALALMLVSLLYQRFVFKSARASEPTTLS